MRKDGFFEPIWGELEELMDARTFVGRAPQQVEKFLKEEVQVALGPFEERVEKVKMAELTV